MNPNGVNSQTGEMADPLATGPALAALVEKLCAAAAEIGVVVKSGENTQQHYKYARAEDVNKAVRAVLFQRGIMVKRTNLTVNYEMREDSSKRTWTYVTLNCDYVFTDGHAEIVCSGFGEGRDLGDKASNKAQTAALKYCLVQNFLLETGDDPEADSTTDGAHHAGPRQATTTVKAAAPRTVAGTKPAEKPAPAQTAPTPAPQPAAAPGAVSGANGGTIGPEGQALLEHWIEERRKERPNSPNMSAQKLVEWAERDSRAPKGSIKELADIPQAQFSKLAITWGFVKTEDGQWAKRGAK